MGLTLYAMAEAAVIASSLSIDAFAAGFAYGSKRIKMPMRSIQIVNFICAAITGISLIAGATLSPYLPKRLTVTVAFAILFTIGLVKLLDSVTKTVIRRCGGVKKEIKGSLFSFRFILNLYADPEEADADRSQSISPMEAAALALSLSFDGIAVGFGAALVEVNALAVFLWSLVTNAALLIAGCYIGEKTAQKTPFNLSWISGGVLIALAFSKLL